MIVEKAYAKINLALEVKDKRTDGYHNVNTIMIPIDLYDELTFSLSDEIIYRSNIEIDNDIVIKALQLFYKKYNIKKGVCITLEKGIPMQAGLAGGSADAAAVLRGLNKLFKLNIENKELLELCEELGSDVSYCLEQKAAYCFDKGQKVKLLDVNYDKYNITLIKPDFGLSTKTIYENYKYVKIDRENNFNNIIKGLENNDIKLIKENIFNDLSKVSIELTPLKKIYEDIKKLGYNVFLSGSGPTLFILDENNNLNEIKNKYKEISILNTKLL